MILHLLLTITILFITRTLYLLIRIKYELQNLNQPSNQKKALKTLIILGSGGHSTEMLRLVKSLNSEIFTPKIYIVASSDGKSKQKVLENETTNQEEEKNVSLDGISGQKILENESTNQEQHKISKNSLDEKSRQKFLSTNQKQQPIIYEIPRSRHVHQSYFTSVFTTLYSILASIPLMIKTRPDLILCNGPGTCVPICLIGFLMRILCLSNSYIVFVESICRVESLSLSGVCLYYFVDIFLVQWPDLLKKYKRAKYIGRF